MDALALAHAQRDDLVRLRHALHAFPEIGLDLPRTQAHVLAELADLGLEISTGTDCTSVTAVLRGTAPRRGDEAPAVLLRADMDALSVREATGLEWASTIPGAMHACGHDLHTSMLVGAARILAAHRDELAGDVVFMFQPGEEMHDGAAVMIREGVLDVAGPRVRAALGLHVMSTGMRRGGFTARGGVMMAAADGFRVLVRGRGGHSSAPHQAVDPITIAAEMILALQTYVTRRFSVWDSVVIGVGGVRAGDLAAPNAIPEEAEFTMSVRSWSVASRAAVAEAITQVVEGIAAAHGAAADVEWLNGYPVTVTDEDETRFAAETIDTLLGPDTFEPMTDPLGGSEDFSRVLALVPGTFVMIGATPIGLDPRSAAPNHSQYAVFDDEVLPIGAAVYAEFAWRRLLAFDESAAVAASASSLNAPLSPVLSH
ncbi:M20 metallopeptidase family protein [Microbacterium sp. P5_E9]